MTFTTTTTPELHLKHLAAMANSLAHRLEIAKASHDEQLTQLLEREYAQLILESATTLSPSHSSLIQNVKAWFERQWQNLADTVPNLYQLHIQEVVADDGQQQWLVHYPKTGQTLRTDSRSHMQAWINRNYWNA